MVTAPARRELVRWMGAKGLTERRSLAIVGMSASALRYEPRPDRNAALRARIAALAQSFRSLSRRASASRGAANAPDHEW
jgi:putative transposase